MHGAASTGNVILGNYIGTDVTGAVDLGNSDDGIDISTSSTTVGGTVAGARNIISGNDDEGIEISGATATGNTILGNYIGTDDTGLLPLGNTERGVRIENGASANIIGGNSVGARNVISGNTSGGISLSGSNSNTVQGNYIGTNAAGASALGNVGSGIRISSSASNNIIGGGGSNEGNLISGNTNDGVHASGAGTNANIIQGNVVGLDAAGTAVIANLGDGVDIEGGTGTIVGGSGAGEGNIVSGNGENGIELENITNAIVEGNIVGTDAGLTLSFGNQANGLLVELSAVNNRIGGTAAGSGNVFVNNLRDGIAMDPTALSGNSFLGNAISGNTGLGIDLNDDGVTPNDAGDGDTGVNDLLNFPVINSITADGTTTVAYDLNLDVPASANGYRIEFFSNPSGADPSRQWRGRDLSRL